MPEWHKSYDFTLERGMQTFDLLVPAHVELALAAVRGPAEMRVFTMARHGFAVFDSTVGAPPSVWANGMYGVVAGLERAGDGNNNPWMLHVTVEAPPSRGPCTIKLTGWKPEEDGMEDKALNNENTADATATTSDTVASGGGSDTLVFELDVSSSPIEALTIVVDPNDALTECAEDNNTVVIEEGLCP